MPLEGLNDEQRAAAQAVRGPVCILAGAGSGKTTTLTRRIANQIATGTFRPNDVLALTFTDRAANELKRRLKPFGEVRARTFHAEALAQVAHFGAKPDLLPSKAMVLSQIVRTLPRPYKFKATKDVAAEIERAKNMRKTPETYDDPTVLPPDLMTRVFRAYEKRKGARLDFEDLLERAIALMDTPAAGTIRNRYKAFSVDEYQDVNLLQQTLLDAWLAGRDEICVVGDDYQSIYGFTGATPRWLIDFPKKYPNATVVALTRNYRSTPQVLDVANRLTKGPRDLTATRPDGPGVALASYADGRDETEAIVAEIDKLAADGTPFEEIAILYRINARSDDYEEALAAARIPYQVRDGAFLRRPGPRAVLRRVQRADGPAAQLVEKAARDLGWDPDSGDEPDGTEEATRLADLARLVKLAEEHGGSLREFLADLRKRFEDDGAARGVVLSTYHRAKGLEWDAVFLPRLEEREIPFAMSKSDDEVAEERRLLYVGITRARSYLRLSYARTRDGKNVRPSRFLAELRNEPPAKKEDPDLFAKLRAWRKTTADAGGVPPYVVFHDSTLREICEHHPGSLDDLARVSGVGPAKLERYGRQILDVLRQG